MRKSGGRRDEEEWGKEGCDEIMKRKQGAERWEGDQGMLEDEKGCKKSRRDVRSRGGM